MCGLITIVGLYTFYVSSFCRSTKSGTSFSLATRCSLNAFARLVTPSAARCPMPKNICFALKMSSLAAPPPSSAIVSPTRFARSLARSTISSFCSYSCRGEAAPRASRCFICLSALFITCNLALARARVISYWFSAQLPFVPRAIASSPPLLPSSSPSSSSSSIFPFLLLLLVLLLLRPFCLSSER